MVILGVDPGTAIVGYGIIKTNIPKHLPQHIHDKPKVIDFGCIITSKSDAMGKRLKIIYQGMNALIKTHKPDIISVESLYFFKNLKTVMPVSQAKGVILLAAAQKNIPICEFTPLQMKMTVVGYGRAEKKQVQKMTMELLDVSGFNLKEHSRKKDDAMDALAIALCAILKKR